MRSAVRKLGGAPADVIIPRANALFASTVAKPEKVNYKNADQAFSAWGYTATRSNTTPTFVNLSDTRLDARSFTVRAQSRVQVTTPAAFMPGRTYNVGFTNPDGTRDTGDVVADSSGRLKLQLDPSGGAVAVTVGTS